eukprot:5571042-Amphidinium_carterae.1
MYLLGTDSRRILVATNLAHSHYYYDEFANDAVTVRYSTQPPQRWDVLAQGRIPMPTKVFLESEDSCYIGFKTNTVETNTITQLAILA